MKHSYEKVITEWISAIILIISFTDIQAQPTSKQIHEQGQMWLGFFNQTRLSDKFYLWMLVATTATEIVKIPQDGFYETAHGARTDFYMLLSTLFLFIAGGGK